MKTKYVLISPVRNEESYIERTLRSIIDQTILPVEWVIISDHSTDRTDEIVRKYARDHPFIKLIRKKGDARRNFGSKARAIAAAYESLKHKEFDFIGNLDGDIALDRDYYERIFQQFDVNPRLGIAGGVIMDMLDGKYVRSISSLKHTAGAIQLFRRECYETIGGYRPLKNGGIDSYAAITARMLGWETQTFGDIPVYHLRPSSTAGRSCFGARFYEGQRDYYLGDDPLFALFKSIRRMPQKPFFIGSFIRYAGYLTPLILNKKRDVSEAFVNFHRREQWHKIRMSVALNSIQRTLRPNDARLTAVRGTLTKERNQ